MIKQLLLGVGVLASFGCTMEQTTAEEASEELGHTEQAITKVWKSQIGLSGIVGMARNSAGVHYTWTSSASGTQWSGCRGTYTDPCSTTTFSYASDIPGPNIRGGGISSADGKVYSWGKIGTSARWAKGTSTNLGASGPFRLPLGIFSIDQLIEVDSTVLGAWVFYWRIGQQVTRTTSWVPEDGGELGPTVIVGGASDGSDIVGISMGGSIFTQRIYTHYLTTSSGGPVNLSSSFSDLAQP
ncbi:MAG TPA: hypothetical protein VEX18_15220 [Polyangiaceae bacterium]|nr:hypothetical protein [Polyangiaceae bacterium]